MYTSFNLNNKVMVRNVAVTDDNLLELKPAIRNELTRRFWIHRIHVCSESFKSICLNCFLSGRPMFRN